MRKVIFFRLSKKLFCHIIVKTILQINYNKLLEVFIYYNLIIQLMNKINLIQAGASNNNNLVGGAPNKSQQSGKNKLAFMLKTTKLTKASRYICKDLLNIKSYSRKPFRLINSTMIKMQCKFFISFICFNFVIKLFYFLSLPKKKYC